MLRGDQGDMPPKVVYVAGPYASNPDKGTALAVQAGAQLLELGFVPLIPHVLGRAMNEVKWRPESEWLAYGLYLVGLCDVVLRLPGTSRGADGEERRAKLLGKKVYRSIAALMEDCR